MASVTLMQNTHRKATAPNDHGTKDPLSKTEALSLDRRGLANAVLHSVGEAVYEWDVLADRMIWSDGAADLLCIPDPALLKVNRHFNSLLLPQSTTTRDSTLAQAARSVDPNGTPFCIQYGLSGETLGTGSDIWIEEQGRWFGDETGQPIHAHGVVRLINERRQSEERLHHLSRFDPLTGLFNRSHLNACLEQVFKNQKQSGKNACFMVVGLEHFDLINSVYGYDAGDEVITEIAKRLNENLRDNDIVGRFSGAKIGIILPECNEHDMLVAGYRVLNLLRENVIVTAKGPIAISVSVGGVCMPQQARTSREVFVAAQQALLESRRARDAAIVVYQYDAEKARRQLHDAQTAERIVTALKQGHIHLAFQPIVDAKTNEVAFHEALLRLHTPDGMRMDAGDFVSIAQRLGLIRLVDYHALDLAIDVLRRAPKARFSLNVSNETACDPEWLSKLASAIYANPSIPGRLIVEITESHAAESLDEARRFITSIRDLGLEVALDDFGAGFTSFRNLKELSFDIIKVDGQFMDNVAQSRENQSFIKALVGLSHLFDAKVVVEWVEDEASSALLRDWNVDYLQGYWLGKPSRDLPWPAEAEA